MKKIVFLMALFIFTVSTGFCSNETFVIKELNLEMVKCPAGQFKMGNPKKSNIKKNSEHRDDTLHDVIITKAFYIGKFEVTQNQYVSVMSKNQSSFKDDLALAEINNTYKPVESVSYYDAKAFCDKLNLKYKDILPKGYRFDLPTEAQWEYACRAGTTTGLNNGKDIVVVYYGYAPNLGEVAWNEFNVSNGYYQRVGQKKPNAWGIYDMHGNVSEWCRDWYGEYLCDVEADPTGVSSGSCRVIRGGDVSSNVFFCSSYRRECLEPSKCFKNTGFRVALVPID